MCKQIFLDLLGFPFIYISFDSQAFAGQFRGADSGDIFISYDINGYGYTNSFGGVGGGGIGYYLRVSIVFAFNYDRAFRFNGNAVGDQRFGYIFLNV